jgi:hypothetical protein
MDTRRTGHRHGWAGPHYHRRQECRLRAVRREAEATWTPGQALGEILCYLDRVEYFTNSEVTASSVQQRMRWLTSVLAAAVQRTQFIGLDPGRLDGIFSALAKHDTFLDDEQTVSGSHAKATRDLVRLEISYLTSAM